VVPSGVSRPPIPASSALEACDCRRSRNPRGRQRAPAAPALAYYRVSTQRQGRSGPGLEAQREAVERFAEREGYELVGDPYVEVETGKGADALERRPRPSAIAQITAWLDENCGAVGWVMTPSGMRVIARR
jgi:hypothetical protein